MKSLLFSLLCMLCSIISIAQIEDPTRYSKIYFEADQTQFKKLSNLLIFEHLAISNKGFVGDFDQEEKLIIQTHASNVKIQIEDVSKYYEERAREELKNNPTMLSANTKKTRSGVPANYHGGTMGGYMTLSQMQQNLDSMALLYPSLISSKQVLGYTAENRPILYYKISDNHAINEPQEHKILYTALHHAREPQSAALVIYYMWYLLENYNTPDSVIKHLIDDREMYFIPVLNPDGYVRNETTNPNGGGMWRKNRRNNLDNTYGVDLNRNYATFWGFDNAGSSPTTSSDTYRGPAAFSENETQIARDFTILKKFKMVLNYHAYGDWFIYPWGYANLLCPDDTTYKMVAEIMTKENQYFDGNFSQTLNYLGNGTSDDWGYGEQVSKPKAYSITPEVGSAADGFWPAPSQNIPLCQENLYQNIMGAWLSGPYIEHKRQGLYSFPSTNVSLQFSFKNRGLDTCLQLKSWFVSTNNWIQQNNDTMTLNQMITHDEDTDNLSIIMQNNTPNNTIVNGRLYTKYNNFVYSDTVSFMVKNAVGINYAVEDLFMNIAPNPSNGIFHITLQESSESISYQVVDARGQLLISTQKPSDKSFTIDLASLANCIYFAEINRGASVKRVKLVKY
ncbi:MAG: T9SS type A sorting domain-containing protein [Bacteroidetes bacterium]|nr:T9SS type A sorting domain-containing protein [Bacteroidota bacterium]